MENTNKIESTVRVDLTKWEKMYAGFDAGHNMHHIKTVRDFAVQLAKKYCPDKIELVYVAATLHDIGLSQERANHEVHGAKIVSEDPELGKAYGKEELIEIVEAVREHRASTGNPNGIVAKIVSDADKISDSTEDRVRRAYKYGLEKFPELDHQAQIERAAKHLSKKFGKGGTGTRLYFEESTKRLKETTDPIVTATENEDWTFFDKILQDSPPQN